MTQQQREMTRMEIENEQQQIAEIVKDTLTEEGFPCHIEPYGKYRVNGFKIQKLKILPDFDLTEPQQEKFDKRKDELAYEYGKMRKQQKAEERKELKKQMKEEKRKKK